MFSLTSALLQEPGAHGPQGKMNPAPGALETASLPEFNPNPKKADGKLDDWGNGQNIDYFHYTHLYGNEAQWTENGLIPEKPLPGAITDEPINEILVLPEARPLGSGINLVSGLVSFDPIYQGGSYWIAWDLPGATNPKVSDGFCNRFVYDVYGITLYPIPFDADCNQNRDTIDPLTIIGAIDEHEHEFYRAYLFVGGDEEQAPNRQGRIQPERIGDDRYNGPGYLIFIEFSADLNHGIPYSWQAVIPGEYTKSGSPIDLGPAGLNLIEHSSPESAGPPAYDIEVEISGILTHVWPLIDPMKVGYPPGVPMTIWDNYHAFLRLRSDADGDFSNEDRIEVGINVLLGS